MLPSLAGRAVDLLCLTLSVSFFDSFEWIEFTRAWSSLRISAWSGLVVALSLVKDEHVPCLCVTRSEDFVLDALVERTQGNDDEGKRELSSIV